MHKNNASERNRCDSCYRDISEITEAVQVAVIQILVQLFRMTIFTKFFNQFDTFDVQNKNSLIRTRDEFCNIIKFCFAFIKW